MTNKRVRLPCVILLVASFSIITNPALADRQLGTTTTISEIDTAPNLNTNSRIRGKNKPYQPFIHRIYGEENAQVRTEVRKLEKASSYWTTGVRGDPDFKVPYDNHPYALMEEERQRRRRHLQANDIQLSEEEREEYINRNLDEVTADSASKFQSMRIEFDTSALDGQLSANNRERIDFIKNEILPRTGDFWSSALSVVPVAGNLKIQNRELINGYCGDSEFALVPDEHKTTGIPDVDLIIYVSGTPSSRFCGANTLAVAVACNFDDYDRPVAGAINFCLEQVDLEEDGSAHHAIIDDNVDVAIHETAHILGMSSNSFRFFWDPKTGSPRTNRMFSFEKTLCVDGVEREEILPDENTLKFIDAPNGQRHASIVTSTVQAVVRNQFNCQDLEGAQLENQPTGEGSCTGDHWDERLFYPEAMSGVIAPSANILSPVTLALMEDSGWYAANYSQAKILPWGHGVGCDFVTEKCLKVGSAGKVKVPNFGRGFFCTSATSRGCSPSHFYKMGCTVIDYSLYFNTKSPEERFQYFPEEPTIGGPRQADYCPIFGSTGSYRGDAKDLDCRDPDNQDPISSSIHSEVHGENSMCFQTDNEEGRCYEAKCIVNEFVLKIGVRGTWYTCEEDFQEIAVKSEIGGLRESTIICPRLSSVCPEMFCPANCAGRGVCDFENVDENGIPSPKCNCFDESDTSVGCSDTLQLDGKYLDDSSELVNTIKRGFFAPLVSVFTDDPNSWSTTTWAWASGLFVVLLLLVLCICSSFWPKKKNRRKVPRSDEYY